MWFIHGGSVYFHLCKIKDFDWENRYSWEKSLLQPASYLKEVPKHCHWLITHSNLTPYFCKVHWYWPPIYLQVVSSLKIFLLKRTFLISPKRARRSLILSFKPIIRDEPPRMVMRSFAREMKYNEKNILVFNVCLPDPFQNRPIRPDRC